MNVLSVENISKDWNEKKVLDNVSFGISKGEKVALVAKNGNGKTTLLNIITGKESADSGVAIIRKEIKVGYLAQDPQFPDAQTVLDCVLEEKTPATQAIADYELALSNYDVNPSDQNLGKLNTATEKMNELGAWDYEFRVKQILTQLKITGFDASIGSLSGGQKKRVALARVLISNPDFLILDEPTNHLDLEMIEWLENYLMQKDLTLLLVTHDRYFLDRVCDQIVELHRGNLYKFKGNYSYYIENKAHRQAVEESELEKDKNIFRRELEWVRRMPKARGTKSKSRTEAFYDLEDKIRSQKKDAELKISIRMERLGGKVLELHHLKKSFGEKNILNDFNYLFKKGEKVGIVGPNGVGKSTLLNLIMGEEKPDAGKITSGETVKFGYYSQHNMPMSEGKKVIDVVRDVADWIPMANGHKLTASQLLLQFQFTPETQYNYVSKLSGGEKRRLFLLRILMDNPNFLILDEPTNDLDIETLATLEEFLLGYGGCLIVVSHDRYFMDKVVDHLFVFEGNGNIKDFPGNYSDYRVWVETEEERKNIAKEQEKEKQAATSTSGNEKSSTKKAGFKEKYEFEQLSKEIENLQQQKAELENELSLKSGDYQAIIDISKQLETVKEQLDTKEMRWLELSEIV